MVPSPRKRASRQAFDQTWDVTDAAFFDPDTLPVARIPRGWERRQETKRTEEGKEKKIWRRFNLRSRASDANEVEPEEEHDARSRPVKKLQQMSPKAMEKSDSRRHGRQRAFQATRWDRRKSVLPRTFHPFEDHSISETNRKAGKRSNIGDDGPDHQKYLDLEIEEGETLESNGKNEDSIVGTIQLATPTKPDPSPLIAEGDRRATFSFVMNTLPSEVDDASQLDMEDMDNASDARPMGDETISNLFRSPVKQTSQAPSHTMAAVEYPQLPTNVDLAIPDTLHVANEAEMNVDTPLLAQEESEDLCDADEVINASVYGDIEESAARSETLETQSGNAEPREDTLEFDYPTLPAVLTSESAVELPTQAQSGLPTPVTEDEEMSEDSGDGVITEPEEMNSALTSEQMDELTEESVQLDLQQDFVEAECEIPESYKDPAVEECDGSQFDDITNGLTLSFTPVKTVSTEPAPKKLHSPPPPLLQSEAEDATMTVAIDDDTAMLKDFLTRAAASKAEKAAVITHRRESLQNRRDSDVIRHALASPRKALEAKDPNSPSKYDSEVTLDLSQTLTLSVDKDLTLEQPETEDPTDAQAGRGSRRSSRAKKSRLPAPASVAQVQAQASKIAIRRQDGTEHVVLKKTDVQELATITRANTRKNKQGAFVVSLRLLKLMAEAASLPPVDDSTKELIVGKNVRWDEQLNYYQENPETVAERESLATPDELGMPEPASTPTSKPKLKVSKNSTPKIRRVRGLGSANGTPGKGLLAPASLLPEAVQEEKEAAQTQPTTQQIPRPKASKIKKMPVAPTTELAPTTTLSETKLPSLEVAPVGVEAPKERKSRLAAPKKVTLPQPIAAVATSEKENTQRSGIAAATPKKGIPAPKVTAAPKAIVPPVVGMESGLPRRRGRKI